MRKLYSAFFLSLPAFGYGQTHVGPDGYFLYLALGFFVGVPLLVWLLPKLQRVTSRFSVKWPWRRKIEVELIPNRLYRPDRLTLVVRNGSRKDVDLKAPVLVIRKLWSIRKFKLKGIDRAEIYPLYLEKGKTHELPISLGVFHRHDPTLRSYYWARVQLNDTSGRHYATKYITLRKSLFS